ncbi:MAG: ankyrin repeat domain-containing protein [Desulfitobacteriaceae bacterium]
MAITNYTESLITQLNSKENDQVEDAIKKLGSTNDERAIRALINKILEDDWCLIPVIKNTILAMDRNITTGLLIDALFDENYDAKSRIVEILGEVDRKDAIEALVKVTNNDMIIGDVLKIFLKIMRYYNHEDEKAYINHADNIVLYALKPLQTLLRKSIGNDYKEILIEIIAMSEDQEVFSDLVDFMNQSDYPMKYKIATIISSKVKKSEMLSEKDRIFEIIRCEIHNSDEFSNLEQLVQTIEEGNMELVKQYISLNMVLNLRNSKGDTPLSTAAKVGNEEIVKLLIDKGAEVNYPFNPLKPEYNRYIQLMFDICRESNDDDVIFEKMKKILYFIGQKREMFLPIYDCLPLLKAVEGGHLEIVRLLLDHGARVNCKNLDRETALIIAAKNNDVKIIKEILSRDLSMSGMGAKATDPFYGANLTDGNGETALMAAARVGKYEAVKALVLSGKVSLSMTSSKKINKQFLITLLQDEEDRYFPELYEDSCCGKSAIEIAEENGHTEIVDFLSLKGDGLHGN